MRASHFLAPLFLAATSLAQAVEEGIAPDSPAPEGCETTTDGSFMIGTLDHPSLGRRETAEEAANGDLSCSIKDGILHDQYGRTGSVVANHQFQFDGPPQAGAIYTGGFSVCANGSLAIGGSTRWWRCMSGDFGNLYDESIGAQCHEIRIQATFPASASSSSVAASGSAASSATSSALSGSISPIEATSTSGLTSESPSSTSMTSGASSATGFSTAKPFSNSATPSGSASGKSPSASSASAAAAAPPASAASSAYITRGALAGLAMVFLGAAIML
ncbi:hypothetical protein EJ02DRAFT_239836 [Clathrospora elynae]|uniref:Cell wall mannoprotein PIR1-like C-terminal domain-containing protein n=1 Tax=Clathrospora elynae TaxID=706981 RepID=A0A6A5SSJ8_9PLEO|nr:hypothetical protein EJ02DRAFT_239836 [Clathrospora elynae]